MCFPKELERESQQTNQLVVLTLQIVVSIDNTTPKHFLLYLGFHLISMNMNIPYLIGVRSLPLLRSRCKEPSTSYASHNLTNVWVHNHLHPCAFTMGKAHYWWGTFAKLGALDEAVQFILGTFFWECPLP